VKKKIEKGRKTKNKAERTYLQGGVKQEREGITPHTHKAPCCFSKSKKKICKILGSRVPGKLICKINL
jgi:hypothetical protein